MAVSFSGMGGRGQQTLVSVAQGRVPGGGQTACLHACMYVSNVPASERGQKFRAVRSQALNILGIMKHRIGHGWREKDHQAAWTSIGPN